MTTAKDKKVYASLFMMLLIISPLNVLSDNSFCTNSWEKVNIASYIAGALTCDGQYYAWGVNQFGSLGLGSSVLYQTTPALVGNTYDNWRQVELNEYYTVGLKTNGQVFGWGMNTFGNLGNAVAVGGIQYTPAQIANLGNNNKFIAVHGLTYTTYVIKNDGSLWAVGDNSKSQLGVASTTVSSTNVPRRIGFDNNWASIVPAARDSHVCGLKTNGNLFCWGESYYYQAGNGTMTDVAAPVRILGAGDSFKKVIVNQYYTLALHNNGKLYGFGTTFWGVFGDGNAYSQYTTPTQVAGGLEFIDIAAFDTFVLAVGENGKLYGWGDNTYTQVNSNPGVGIQTTPNIIHGSTYWRKVYTSKGLSMNAIGSAFALRNDGRLYAWGSNNVGQLGLGSASASVSTPTQVLPGVTFEADVSVGYVTAVIDTKNQLYVTGFNNFNLLGDGTISSANTFFSCSNRAATCYNHVCSARLRV